MALELSQFSTEHGVDIANAYCRIDSYRGDRESVTMWVGVYVSAAARAANKPAITQLGYTMPTPNTEANMFAGAYEWLKTQPQFHDAGNV